MLLRYIVSNFKSIGHRIEFSMFPTEHNTDMRFLTEIDTKMGKWNILRRGAVFGPNASGKSAFIESMEFARDYIVDGQKSGKNTGVNPFKGYLEDLHGLSTFQFMFYLDGEVYDYGFSLDYRQVHEEWLEVLATHDFMPVFTRTTDKNGKTEIEIEDELADVNHSDRTLAEVLKDGMQENQRNQLFLYKLYDNGIKKAEKIVDWFQNVQVIFPYTKLQGLPIRVSEDENFREFISKTLNMLDTGVSQISVVTDEINFKELADKMDIPAHILHEIEEIKNGIVSLNGKYFIFSEDRDQTKFIQVKFEHHLNDQTVRFNIEDESDGTQRLLDLLPILFRMENESKKVYFVDELDRSLHTKLSKYFLDAFIQNQQGTLNQIIFTAHDVNLIDLKEFRQEEIWLIAKNNRGESMLRPLSDFAVQEDQNALKDYLNGRFGAVPVIRRYS